MQKKKTFTDSENQSKFTYHLGRECRNCHAVIPDNDHATREFCPPSIDQNGNIRDCKTSYHRQNDKPMRELIAKLVANHKGISSRIDFLCKKHGMEVSSKLLETYEIDLRQSIEYDISTKCILTSVFLNHTIISNPITDIHKISCND